MKTQGHEKMMRYIEGLIRNKEFLKTLNKLRSLYLKNHKMPEGSYYDWTPEQQKKHDEINDELSSIIKGYEALKKRCQKIYGDKYFKTKEQIAETYGLDNELIHLATALERGDKNGVEFVIDNADMCRITDRLFTEYYALNEGDEIIHLRHERQLHLLAYPVSIDIHSRATKRDILDFVEKQWKWIESTLRLSDDKPLLARKRKHSQEIIDFIWANQQLPSKELKEKLDETFPKNGLAYYEISKIVYLERQRRGAEI